MSDNSQSSSGLSGSGGVSPPPGIVKNGVSTCRSDFMVDPVTSRFRFDTTRHEVAHVVFHDPNGHTVHRRIKPAMRTSKFTVRGLRVVQRQCILSGPNCLPRLREMFLWSGHPKVIYIHHQEASQTFVPEQGIQSGPLKA